MDDLRRESNRSKRSRSEIKHVVNSYLQKRNYCLLQPFEVTKDQQLTYSQIENQVSRSNTVLYKCPNSDQTAIDQNFMRFSLWLKEQKFKNLCLDLDKLVGPLFCHFYIEILKGEQKDKAGVFFRTHFTSFDATNCDPLVNELITLFKHERDISHAKELFRSKKTVIDVTQESLDALKTFVLKNCHVVFLQVLQNWFDFRILIDSESEMTDSEAPESTETALDVKTNNPKIHNILQAIADLNAEPIPIFSVTLSRTKNFVATGILRRQASLIAFGEENALNIMPLNSLDNLLNITDSVERVKITDHKEKIYSIDISDNNTLLATASGDHTACVYDLNEMRLLNKCDGHLGPVYVVKISNTCEYIATGSADHTARLWDIATGKTIRIFVGHNAPITCLDFHPNCLYLATGSSDRNIRMWCLTKAVTLRLLHGCKDNVLALSFSPAGKYLASASQDRKVRIWELLTSKAILELRCDGAPIHRLVWNKTGRELCAGSNDSTVRVWDLGKMQENDWDNGRQHEPTVTRKVVGRLLSLEYTFGTYGTLNISD